MKHHSHMVGFVQAHLDEVVPCTQRSEMLAVVRLFKARCLSVMRLKRPSSADQRGRLQCLSLQKR